MSSDPTTSESAEAEATSGSSSHAGLALSAALAALVVLILVAALGIGAASTVACSYCHASQATAFGRSPHAGIPCSTCHFSARGPILSRLDVLTRMLPSSIGGVRLVDSGRPVGGAVCVYCHTKIASGGVVSKNGLRINHSRCSVTSTCEDCHSQSIHGTSTRFVRTSSMTACFACHVANKAPVGCSVCHAGQLPAGRQRDPEWIREHGPDWKTMHGTGDLRSCASCHTSDSCRPCHLIDFPHPSDFGATHGALAKSVGEAACLTCHKQSAYCTACHGVEMPHPVGFLQAHSRIAKSATDPKCVTCHVASDCEQCHTYHIHPGGTAPPVGRNGVAR
jgi:hypothetical protein